MKRNAIRFSFLYLCLVLFMACEKEETKAPGNPTITINSNYQDGAYFADSLGFDVQVSDSDVPLSTLKVLLYYGDDVVSEEIIRTKDEGNYKGKIFVPYYANIPNGEATLKFVLQNVNLTIQEEAVKLPLQRPDYPFLTLVADDGTRYQMDRTASYMYEAEESFPMKLRAYIEAPAYGDHGNVLHFGYEGGNIREGVSNFIPFSYLADGVYPINFNTMTYEAGPFMSYTINGTDLQMVSDDLYSVDLTLSKDQVIDIEGIPDVGSWWIDSDYFRQSDDGELLFDAMNGRYRITADFEHSYFIVEALQGAELATLTADGNGAIWIIGDGIGKPNMDNQVGWTTEKALCLAPIGDKKYRITVVAGENVWTDYINFKFFHQKGWGGEFGGDDISTDSDIIFIGDGSNDRDPGNLGIASGEELEEGATYVLTVDVSAGINNAVLLVEKQ